MEVTGEIFTELVCEPCGDNGQKLSAVGFCVDCTEYLCRECYKHHCTPRPCKNHVLLDEESMPKSKQDSKKTSIVFDSANQCSKHKGEMIKFYCRSDSALACGSCIALDHYGCDKPLYIEEEYEKFKAKLSQLNERIEYHSEKKDQNSLAIKNIHSKAIGDIKIFMTDIKEHIERLETTMIVEADKLKDDNEHKINAISATCMTLSNDLHSLTTDLSKLHQTQQNGKLLTMMVKASDQMKSVAKNINQMNVENTVQTYSFIPKKQIGDIISSGSAFGELAIEQQDKPNHDDKTAILDASEEDKLTPENKIASIIKTEPEATVVQRETNTSSIQVTQAYPEEIRRSENTQATFTKATANSKNTQATLTKTAANSENTQATLTKTAANSENTQATLTKTAANTESTQATLPKTAANSESTQATLTKTAANSESTQATLTKTAAKEKIIAKVVEPIQQISQTRPEITSKSKTDAKSSSIGPFMSISLVSSINVKSKSDRLESLVSGLALLPDDKLLIADCTNLKVKLFNTAQHQKISELKLPSQPRDITVITDTQVAITMPDAHQIQLLSIFCRNISLGQIIKVKGECHGIVHNDGTLLVTFIDPPKVEIISMKGTVLRVFDKSTNGEPLFEDPGYIALSLGKDHVYITDWDKNSVTCMSLDGKVKGVYKDKYFKKPRGVNVDKLGLVYVVGGHTNSYIYQVSGDCSQGQELLEVGKNLLCPWSMTYCHKGDKLYVGQQDNSIKVLQLK